MEDNLQGKPLVLRRMEPGLLLVRRDLPCEAVHRARNFLNRRRAASDAATASVERPIPATSLPFRKACHDPPRAVQIHDSLAGIVQRNSEEVGDCHLLERSGGPLLEFPPAGRGGFEEEGGPEEATDKTDGEGGVGVGDCHLLERSGGPLLEFPPAGRGGFEEEGGPEEATDKTDGEGGVGVRWEDVNEGLEETALPDAGVAAVVGGRGAGGKGKEFGEGLLGVYHDGGSEGFWGDAAGFHGGEDLLEGSGGESGELTGPPIWRGARRDVSLVECLQ
ncbi:hypothetical protein C4D60_Mb05t31300 [Musa balbisiana]|uniref:Uncharacterized protein n=1 Tax=Musa balbisiana TaxID=52838 RepID=A0A4S8K056_MUSBA|nr:hypothetical protein C4D60_Mb05t31300 [Musa balbisiana]